MVKKAKVAAKVAPKIETVKAFDAKSEPKVVVKSVAPELNPKESPNPKAEKRYTNGFVFTGDPVGGSDPAWISMHGYMFGLNGRVIEVNDEVAAKLRTHSHFTEK